MHIKYSGEKKNPALVLTEILRIIPSLFLCGTLLVTKHLSRKQDFTITQKNFQEKKSDRLSVTNCQNRQY